MTLGERELVVRPLNPRLAKVKDISAAALMEDGSPVLILDVEDLLRSMGKLAGFSLEEIAGMFGPDGAPDLPRARLRAKADDIDRQLLKEAMKVGSRLQQRLALDWLRT